jgi:hypothetical protein
MVFKIKNIINMDFLNYDYRIKLRKKLVNYLYKKLKETNIPNEVLSFMVKCWHFSIFYMVFLLCIFAPKFYGITGVIISGLFVPIYYYFDGCFVSYLEYKLSKKKYVNVIDPYLGLLGYDINDENRKWITPKVAFYYFNLNYLFLFIRFHKDYFNFIL